MYPHQGAKRSSLKALSHDLSNHSLNYLSWLWTVWRYKYIFSFKHYDLFQNICKKSWLTSHLGNSSALSWGWVVSSVWALFQKHKIPDMVKFFSYRFVDKRRAGKGREGKAAVRNARARCCIARPEVSGTFCYGNGHKNAPPCLRK